MVEYSYDDRYYDSTTGRFIIGVGGVVMTTGAGSIHGTVILGISIAAVAVGATISHL